MPAFSSRWTRRRPHCGLFPVPDKTPVEVTILVIVVMGLVLLLRSGSGVAAALSAMAATGTLAIHVTERVMASRRAPRGVRRV